MASVLARGPWRRGGRRASGGGGGAAPAWTPASASPFVWFREDATDDGSGRANPWIDKSANGFDASNGTATARPTIGTDARLAGQFSLAYDGGDLLIPSFSVTQWALLHNGSGCTFGWAGALDSGASGNQIIFTSQSSVSSVARGFTLRADATSQNLDVFISNGTILNISNSGLGTFTRNVGHRISGQCTPTGIVIRLNGSEILNTTYTGATSTGDATGRGIGSLPGISQTWLGGMSDLFVLPSLVSLDTVDAYLLARYT